jgi:hypothetical protein
VYRPAEFRADNHLNEALTVLSWSGVGDRKSVTIVHDNPRGRGPRARAMED